MNVLQLRRDALSGIGISCVEICLARISTVGRRGAVWAAGRWVGHMWLVRFDATIRTQALRRRQQALTSTWFTGKIPCDKTTCIELIALLF